MLRPLDKQTFLNNVDLFYELATSRNKSAYPTYSDKIKTKEHFKARTLLGMTRDNEEVLGYFHQEQCIGFIHFYFIGEDDYLQLLSFQLSNDEKFAMSEFLNYLNEHYSRFDYFFGFPSENKQMIDYLINNGFYIQEESDHHVLFFENYQLRKEDTLIKVDKNNFDPFRKLHQLYDEDMYWTSERLYEKLDDWHIYMLQKHEQTLAAIYFTCNDIMMEIFGIEYLDDHYNEDIFLKLLVKALNEGKKLGVNHLTFFEEPKVFDVLNKLEFDYIGKYILCCKKK